MAHKDTPEIRVDLELNRAAIAFPGDHPIFRLRRCWRIFANCVSTYLRRRAAPTMPPKVERKG
ncbi:MAG TPA: hypothetical protein VNG69_15545, partial [Casimicrobiaceae bacterium]|nr:hypothetical protein [Casimicrobiaceae bacterium]